MPGRSEGVAGAEPPNNAAAQTGCKMAMMTGALTIHGISSDLRLLTFKATVF